MLAVTIDTAWLTNLDTTTWVILGGLAALWGSKFVPSATIAKLKSWFTRSAPLPVVPDDIADTAAMIQRLRERRVELQKELDLINDALADGTEIDTA